MKPFVALFFTALCLAACGGQSQTQTPTNIELTAQQQEILQRQNAEQQEILKQVYLSGKTVEVCVENSVKKYSCHKELQQHVEVVEKAINMGVSKKDVKMFVSEHLL
ncbi:MAG: hypothetical protein IJ187_05650 [Neisseriaceae bacterium]|nr:hypothetical protein [Neisseriaceae bacterium]